MTKKTKTKENACTIPSSYTLVAADLSLKRPGFCKMKVERENSEARIASINLMSVDNKNKTKPRGELLEEISKAFSKWLSDVQGPLYLVREQSINNCVGKMAHSSTAARTGISAVVGIMDLCAWQFDKLSWEEIYPVSIKKLLTGNGKAEKQEVAESVKCYLGDVSFSNDDESDAAAVAVAWLINHKQIKQIIQEDTPSE